MNSKVISLALAIVGADLVVASLAILSGLSNPALMIAILNAFALFAIFYIHASGIPMLEADEPTPVRWAIRSSEKQPGG